MDENAAQVNPKTLPGHLLARGRTADVYAWEDGYVLKLFRKSSLDDVNYEARIARAVHASGLAVPFAGEIVQVNAHYGLIYERVDGPAMLEVLSTRPWRLLYYARRMAEVHAEMHARSCRSELPSQRRRLESKIRQAAALPTSTQAAVLARLASMPDGERICHGDMHPGNILLTARGEVVIDWVDATCGNPLADVARTSIIMMGAASSAQITNPFMKACIRLFHAVYLRHYFNLCPGGEHEYRRWLPIVAAARLSERIPELESWLVAQVRIP